jgi:hypothetical protein
VHFHAHSLLSPKNTLFLALCCRTPQKTGDPVERAGDSELDLHLTGEGRRFLVNLGMCFVKQLFADFLKRLKNEQKIFCML